MRAYLFLYTTFPGQEAAREAARRLVEAGVVACANIFPAMQSVYRYDGEVNEASEAAVIFKLPASHRAAAAQLLRDSHPYDTPVVAFLDIDPDPATAAWLNDATRSAVGD